MTLTDDDKRQLAIFLRRNPNATFNEFVERRQAARDRFAWLEEWVADIERKRAE
jgi:hypothetical protein